MSALVIGGYGVFGGRLARMLVADGHDVTVAGRSAARAEAFARQIGATGMALDRAGPLPGLERFDVLIDASGPFDASGDDPYRIARAALAAGCHYMDLSDNAAFCAGIGVLDDTARAAGRVALTGVSSVPALSSAAAAELAQGMEAIDMVEAAILPGNRAPRGRSVVESILGQAGRPFALRLDGAETMQRSWSDPAVHDLGRGLRRQGWQIEVPDQRLLPGYLGARSVIFRAGLELAVMRYGLGAWSWVLGRIGRRSPGWMVGPVMAAARALGPFGTDRGGMIVRVTGWRAGEWTRAEWRLRVTDGDGPSIPGVAARALIGRMADLPPGARPALAEAPLAVFEAAMAELATETERLTTPVTPLFARVLGPGLAALPAPIRAVHDVPGPRLWLGRAEVTRGRGPVAALLAALFRFPPAGADVPVTVRMTPTAHGETWERRFGPSRFRSHLADRGGAMTERFGPFRFRLGLHRDGACLHYPVTGGWFLGLPLPRLLLPGSDSVERAEGGRFHFDVALRAPLTGALVVRYRGWLERAVPVQGHKA